MDQDMKARAVARGEVLVLTQRSVRRRDYELRRGDEVVGWVRFPPGRRSVRSGIMPPRFQATTPDVLASESNPPIRPCSYHSSHFTRSA